MMTPRQVFSYVVSPWNRSQQSLSLESDSEARLTDHVECLSKSYNYPRRSTQRFVEQLTFLPNGGQRWTRTLQIQLPPKSLPTGCAQRVVSLGTFRRRRFPDLAVCDANGTSINLLTRHEHGTMLIGAIIAKYFIEFSEAVTRLQNASNSPERQTYNELLATLYERFTTVGDIVDLDDEVTHLASIYGCLLGSFDPTPDHIDKRVEAFRINLRDMLETTPYLCLVEGAPGEIITLKVSYTAADIRHRPEWRIDEPIAPKLSVRWREKWLSLYREYGLAPLKYLIPGNIFTGSYYFSLEPPPKTEVLYLDWTTGNSFQDDKSELDSALDSVHFHYSHDSQPQPLERARKVEAYLRGSPHGHKQIAIGAALNIVLVILLAKGGSLDARGSAQTWLLVPPTALTAYIADQQRHYYAYATRRQRAILWIYLGISVLFLAAASLDLTRTQPGSAGWDKFTAITAYSLLVGSVFVCTWYVLLGYSFRLVTKRRTISALRKAEAKAASFDTLMERFRVSTDTRQNLLNKLPSSSEIYDIVVYHCCSAIAIVVVIFTLLAGLVLGFWWNPIPGVKSSQNSVAATIQRINTPGTLTMTTWPSKDCKGCNVDLRFVPSAKTNQSK